MAGLTSVILTLSVLSQGGLARPNPGIVQRDASLPAPLPVYYEHKHQRVYRNDDLEGIYIREAKNIDQVKRSNDASAVTPKIESTKILGNSPADPVMEFLNVQGSHLPTLPSAMYAPEINTALTTSPQYNSYYNGSGSVSLDSTTKPYLEKMKYKPRLSRDNGLGGKVSGKNLFIFADTETFTDSGKWTGFVSNSVASNGGHQAKEGKPPILHDKLGQWANNMGTMRNWIPFTEGEAAFNAKMAGKGQRYGIWPMSSLINIDDNSAYLYAPMVFTNTKHGDKMNLINYVGMTLSKVTVPSRGGAIAERVTPMLFTRDDGIEWGGLGGIRDFGGDKVYIMGNNKGGILLGRVAVNDAGNKDAYEYWHSDGTWSSSRPTKDSQDHFVDFAVSTVDVFYSPHHSTFIMVYMTPYVDNKFYWSHLQSPQPIKPAPGVDIVQEITKHPWAEPELLMNLPKPAGGSYAYAGGMHRGYFDEEDITNGGTKMLLSWTQPNGKPSSSPETGYNHPTAEVDFA